MDRHDLNRDQRQVLLTEIELRRNWLHRVHMRMRAQRWREDCAAYLATLTAIEAMTTLLMTLKSDPSEAPADWMKHIGT